MLHSTRSTRNLGLKSALPANAPGPQAEEKAEGSSRPKAVSGIKPQEAPLAGYLLARSALHRKIEDPALANLRAGHASVREVGDLLPLGRSNVREDLAKAKDDPIFLRGIACYKLQRALEARLNPLGMELPEDASSLIFAATSQYAKTGVCLAYAASTTAVHAAKLAGMQDERAIVAHSYHPSIDHVWSEMIPRGKGKDGKPVLHGEDVVMDGWCQENLAVLREDSRFARHGDLLSHEHILDHRSGPGALARIETLKAQIEGSKTLRNTFHNELNRRVARGTEPDEDCLWDAQSVFHADFRQEAIAALHQGGRKADPGKDARIPDADPVSIRAKRASLAEIRAVGVARSLGSNIPGAVAEAPGVIASARDMFPNPLARKRKRESA